LVLQDPSRAFSPEALQLVTLVQPGVPSEVADDADAPGEGPATSLPEILALVDESLQHLALPVGRLFESLLDFADWWTRPPAPSDQANAPLEDSSPAGASVGVIEQYLPPGLAIETEAGPSEEEEPEPGWLASMATLGLVAFAYASRRRGGLCRGGPRRDREEDPSMPRAEDDPRAEPCPGGAEGVPGSARQAS
jgi:hypothetical protein